MALNLGELLVQLGVDVSDLGKAQKAVAVFVDRLENAVKGLQLGVDVSKAEKDMTRASAVIGTATTGMQKKLDGFGQTASGLLVPVGALSSKIKTVADASGATNTALVVVGETAKKTGKALEDTGVNAAKAAKVTEDAAKRVAQETTKAAKAAEDAAKRVAKEQEKAAKAVEEAAKKATEATEKATRKFKDQVDKMERVGSTITKAVTLPLIGLGVVASKAAIDFESAFAGVRKTVDATESQFKELERGIRDMAMRLPASTTEIAKVAEASVQLGVKREGIMKFTETMIKLGTTTNLSADEAATSLARMANIMGVATEDFDRMGATVVALGNAGASTEQDIVSMALRLAGAGKTVGLSTAQVLGFANALSSVGIEAEAGGSAISRVMIEIKNQVASGGEHLKTFASVAGMSAEAFTEKFNKDAAGAIVSFVEGLGRMQASGQNVFPVLDQLGLSEVRVRDALLRASNAGDLFRQSLELGSQSWKENTALNKEAAERYKTVASQIQLLRNQLSEVAISIGQGLVPAIQSAMRNLKPFLDTLKEGAAKFAGMDKATQDSYIKIGLFAAAIGPVIKLVAKLALGITGLIALGKAAALAFVGAGGGAAGFGAALTALVGGPIGWIVVGILGVIAAGYLLIKNWEKVKNFGLAVWGSLKAGALEFAADVTQSYAMVVRLFNKAEADRLQAHANSMRAQGAAERELIKIREGAAGLAEEQAAMQAFRAAERGTQAEQEVQNQASAAEAAQKAATSKAAAEAQTQEAIAATTTETEKATKAQKHAMDVLDYKLGQVEATWDEYKAKVGDVSAGADYLARQKQYLTDKLAALQAQLQYLNGQYSSSKASSGEFGDATMELGSKLNSTRVEIARTQTELAEISGPIQDAKNNIAALGKAVSDTKDRMAVLGNHVDAAKTKLEATSKAVKELQDANKTAQGTIGDALGAMRDRTKDVEERIKSLRQSTKDAQSGIVAAFSAMKSRAGDLKNEISSVRDKMKDLAGVRLIGEGAIDNELADLQKREALAKLALNALKRSGADDKDARVIDLEKQLDKIGLLKEEVQLRREINIDPLKDQLKRLADDTKEMSFEDAKKGILAYQKQIIDLTAQHKGMTTEINNLRDSVSDLVPKIEGADSTFDEAKAAVADFKAIIEKNADALNGSTGLLATHEAMKTQYDTLYKSLGDLVPKIGLANLTFEEAQTEIGKMRDRITENNAKLDGPNGLLALQERQKTTVDLLTYGMGLFEVSLNDLTQKEKEATSALEGLRNAAAAAAAALGGKGSAPAPAVPAEGLVQAVVTAPAAGSSGNAVMPGPEVPPLAGVATPEPTAPLAPWQQIDLDKAYKDSQKAPWQLIDYDKAYRELQQSLQSIAPQEMLGSFMSSVSSRTATNFGNLTPTGEAAMAGVGAPSVKVYIGNREIYDLVVEATEDSGKRGRL